MQAASKKMNALFWAHRRDFVMPPSMALARVLDLLRKANRCNVTVLHTTSTHWQPDGAEALTGLQLVGLRTLCITSDAGLDDVTLILLASAHPHLEHLNIEDCGPAITDEGICAVSMLLPQLQTLNCRLVTKLTDAALGAIGRNLPRLTTLAVMCSPRTMLALDHGAGIEVNSALIPQLRVQVGDLNMPALGALTCLTDLDLGPFMAVGPGNIDTLARLTRLTRLVMPQCQLLDNAFVERLVEQMPGLRELTLNKTQFVDNLGVLTQLQHLRTLTLRSSRVTDDTLALLAALPRLCTLDISWCPLVTPMGVDAFLKRAECSSRFERLTLAHCRLLHADGTALQQVTAKRTIVSGHVVCERLYA